MASDAPRPTGVAAERLRWSLDLGGRSHGLDLLPGAIGRSVGVDVDGRSIGRIPKPSPQHPWREGAFTIGGESVQVGLTWGFPVMRTDVFVGGRSVRDGRTPRAVQADAPAALTNYDVWVGGFFRSRVVHPRAILPHWSLPPIVASAAIWVIALVASPLAPEFRIIGAAALLVASVVLGVIWLRSWSVVMERAHGALLARPGLGDAARTLAFFAALVAYPVVWILVLTVCVTILTR